MDLDPCPHCGAPLEHWELCRACVPSPGWAWGAVVALLVGLLVIVGFAPREPLLPTTSAEGR